MASIHVVNIDSRTPSSKQSLPPLVRNRSLSKDHRKLTAVSLATTGIDDSALSAASTFSELPQTPSYQDFGASSQLNEGSPGSQRSLPLQAYAEAAIRQRSSPKSRQISAPVQVSVAEMSCIRIRTEVPNAMVSHIRTGETQENGEAAAAAGLISICGPEDFSDAFCEGAPSFIVVENRKEAVTLALDMVRTREAKNADAVILILVEQEIFVSASVADTLSDFIANGADDVIVAPACVAQFAQIPLMISASLAKAKAWKQRARILANQMLDYKKQCHELFWSVSHVIVPNFPEVKEQMIEVPEKRVADIDFLGKLGEGQYGAVHKWQRGEKSGAVKVTSKRRVRSALDVAQLVTEFECLKRLNHQNVVGVHTLVHGMQNVYLFMEMAGQSTLFDAMRSSETRGFDLSTAVGIFKQVADGVAHCHGMEVAHCDLKPENMVISDDGCVKIVDFGVAVDLAEDVASLDRPIGTMPFMAPEIMTVSESWNPRAADVWSLGVFFMELLCGNHAFVKLLGWQGKDLKCRATRSHRAEDVRSFFGSDEARAHAQALFANSCRDAPRPLVIQLLFDMLHVTPDERIAVADILPLTVKIAGGL